MLATPDEDDDQDVPAPNWCMDFVCTVVIEAPIAAPR
jgi:hypothetical protein